MDQGLESFVTGLSSSIDKYLGVSNQFKLQANLEASKQNAEMQRQLTLEKAKSADTLARNKELESYKTSLEDKLTPDMAEKALPGYGGKMVSDYNQQHPDTPLTLKGGIDYLKMAMDSLNPDNSAANKHQDKLEKDYADRRSKVLSNRSGGLGLQDAKVNQAIDLRNLINQSYDPKTDTYKIAPTNHAEMVVGLARLLSPNGQVAAQREEALRQDTVREGVAKTLIKWGLANPEDIGGPTQDVSKMLVHMIDRQGQVAEQLRDHYEQGLKDLVPTGLDQKRVEHINKADITSSFSDLLKQSPDYVKHKVAAEQSHPVGKVLVVNPNGQRGYIPAGQLDAALKAGYKQAE